MAADFHQPNWLQTIKRKLQQADFADAIDLCESALANSPRSKQRIELLYYKAVAQRRMHAFDSAFATQDTLLGLRPTLARAWQEKGYCHQALANDVQASKAFFQAVQFNPALLASWVELIPLYTKLKNETAVNLAQEQVNYLQSLPPPLLSARNSFYNGKLNTAESECRRFLQEHKHHPDGMLLLAEIAIKLNALHEAEFLLERCLELYPDDLRVGHQLIKLLSKLGKFSEACRRADTLLERYPQQQALKLMKASALMALGETSKAVGVYQAVRATEPHSAPLELLLGHAYKALGRQQRAIEQYQASIAHKPDFGDAYWSLANTKSYHFNQHQLEQMQQQLESEDTAPEDRIPLLFALGKGMENVQNYEQAFAYYQQGNQLKSAFCDYQPHAVQQMADKQLTFFNPLTVAKLRGYGCAASDPIFIVGLPKAGEVLLQQILTSHSRVDNTSQLHSIPGLVSTLQRHAASYPDCLGYLEGEFLTRCGEKYVEDTRCYRRNGQYFIDNTPGNFLHIGLIKLMLPNARIIDARREPMACCFSNYTELFDEGKEFSYSLAHMGRYYRVYLDVMRHWDEVFPNQILRVQYEEMVADLPTQVRRLLEYCGLSSEQSCSAYTQTQLADNTLNSMGDQQAMYNPAQQWQHFAGHLSSLKQILTD